MITGSIARRYAKALFAIGVDQRTHEQLGREIADLAAAMHQSADLREALTNPVFKRSQRKQVLGKLLTRLGMSTTTRNFCMLLLDRERIVALPGIARELAALLDDHAGRIKAVVTSATPLSPLQQQQVKKALEQVSGKQVIMNQHHDPALLGGVVAQLGDLIYDGSLRTQLERMRTSLTK